MDAKFKYIYGPVYSWRMGMSLGIDPISTQKKICNFDCIYCQLGRTSELSNQRKNFVSVEDIIKEIKALPATNIDYYTFSGRGEPTLAKNLGEMIKAVRQATGGKVAVITNAVLMGERQVQEELLLADFVLAKLDACDQDSLNGINVPTEDVQFQEIVDGIVNFNKKFQGKLALQMMFVEENKKCAAALAAIAQRIHPDEVQINTPLRPSGAAPLSEGDLTEIKEHFKGLPVVTVYEAEQKKVRAFDDEQTIRRHGNFKKGVSDDD